MERSKFSEAQIAFVLRPAEDGTAVGEVCRKAGISEAQKAKDLIAERCGQSIGDAAERAGAALTREAAA